MTTPELVRQAYCTSCGAPLVGGACSGECRAPAAPATSGSAMQAAKAPPRLSHRRVVPALTVGGLLVALTLGGVTVTRLSSTQTRLDEAISALESTQEEVAALGRELKAAQSEQQGASGRLSTLESELKGQPDIPRTAKAASKSVFTIEVPEGNGSGFAVGYDEGSTVLVTNFHVVARTYLNGGRAVDVRRGNLSFEGTITGASESNDLAVITVRERLPILDLLERRPTIGEPVLVLGSPLGLGGTVTSGIVSAFRTEDGLDYLQFSAPISPGNSGGPVVNTRGEVVGVAVAKLVDQGAEGLGFAIPTTRLCTALDVC